MESCCSSDINTKRQQISFDLRGGEHTVWGDCARLQQILWNLMKNAVKFTPPNGHITVSTRNEHETSGAANDGPASAGARPMLAIEVSDTGVGIPADMLPRVFDAFEQGSHAVTRQFGGLGLGLAISKALVDLHGGSISAHSDGDGRGATFTVRLPTTARSPRTSSRSGDKDDSRTSRQLRILLVEDHEYTAEVLARLLRASHHHVHTAATVTDALRAVAGATDGHTFDVVISDLGLPDGSGLDLMRELKTKYNLRGIALSGYGMEEDQRRSLEVGFAAHLTKPVDYRKLQATIAQVVN
jgi:CheY-like chemotaxis protein